MVGPSGAGKDTLLGVAKTALAGDPRFRFARRIITRPAQPEREDYEVIDEHTFRARRDAGAFGLWWQAHGLHYGLPAATLCDLAAGAVVVASVSRSVVAEAAARSPVWIVEVTASADVLAPVVSPRGGGTTRPTWWNDWPGSCRCRIGLWSARSSTTAQSKRAGAQ